MAKTIIIGAGFAGIGAARFLAANKIDSIVFEKRQNPEGNLYASYKMNFDDSSHIVSTKNEQFAKLFNNASDKTEAVTEHLNIRHFFKGHNIMHPPLQNLHKLPKSLIIKIVNEISELKTSREKLACNLKQWLYANFGETYTESLLEKLIQKTYTLSSEKIDFSDMKNEFHRSSFGDILLGALTEETPHPNDGFKVDYPLKGDFLQFLTRAKSEVQIKFGYTVKSIDLKEKIVFFENGEKESYSFLISSMPLPDLIECIKGIPDKIKFPTEKLAWTSCVIVDIAIKRKLASNVHCAFFYDSDIIFSQLIFRQTFSGRNTQENYETIQAHIHFSEKYRPLHLPPNSFIGPVINNLKRCDIIDDNDKIVCQSSRKLTYANIIHDFNRRANLSTIHKKLDELNIFYCGRYGLWNNMKADESFESGENAAKKVKNLFNSMTDIRITPKNFGSLFV